VVENLPPEALPGFVLKTEYKYKSYMRNEPTGAAATKVTSTEAANFTPNYR
jgi:hypothetical protein